MSMADDYDYCIWGDEEEYPVTCQYCNEEGLYWTDTENGWRLFHPETGEIHDCRKSDPKEDFAAFIQKQ